MEETMSDTQASVRVPGRAVKALLLGAAMLVLAGCLSGGPQTRRAEFICEGGERVSVVFQPNTARIISTNPPIVMDRRRTSTGFWFASPQNSIRGSEGRMTWTRGRAMPIQCRETRRR
jgi:hypothetical protein